MRNILITAAAAVSAIAVAAPAAAQVYPAPPPQAYGYGYGQNNYGQVRSLQVRIDNIQRRIERLRERRMLNRNEVNGLRSESRAIERRLRNVAQWGLHPRERQEIEIRIARLEAHVRQEARDGRRGIRAYVYDQNSYGYYDRDRDGRDDRYEDDRGTRHD